MSINNHESDPNITRKLCMISAKIPGSPPPDIAESVFSRGDFQSALMHRLFLLDEPRRNPFFAAFDPRIVPPHLHFDEVDTENCEACHAEMFGTPDEWLQDTIDDVDSRVADTPIPDVDQSSASATQATSSSPEAKSGWPWNG